MAFPDVGTYLWTQYKTYEFPRSCPASELYDNANMSIQYYIISLVFDLHHMICIICVYAYILLYRILSSIINHKAFY